MKTQTELNVKKHEGRNDLIGEHRWGDAGQIILLILFLAIWITDSFFFHYSTFLNDDISIYIRIIAGTLVLVYAWHLARSGLRIIFGEIREKPEVIRKGIFSKVRHPIYLGAILLYLGLNLFSISFISIGFWIIIIIFYILISKYEERILTAHFGQAYIEYKKEVPMLLPKLFR